MDLAALIVVANSLRFEQIDSWGQGELERLEPSLRAGNREASQGGAPATYGRAGSTPGHTSWLTPPEATQALG
jgi:hypothetical protein